MARIPDRGAPYLRMVLDLGGEGRAVRPGEAAIPAPMLRRIVGRALIERFCPYGRPLCEAERGASGPPPHPRERCRVAEACPYGVVFAASLTRRPPYAFHVFTGDNRAGGARIELTLFGPAWRIYSWILVAIGEALRRGVGKVRRPWRVERVARIRPDGRAEPIAGPSSAGLIPDLAPDHLDPTPAPGAAPGPVTVQFLSPARLLRDGRLLPGREPVPFGLLIARILDRFADLYGPDASEVLAPEIRRVIEADASAVPQIEDDTRWFEVRDYSSRSRSELLLGGKVGRAVYGGAAGRFLPILRAGEIVHVGKNAASGCGRIGIETSGG